jgi:ABC-type uncharacterized transport system permease subunit
MIPAPPLWRDPGMARYARIARSNLRTNVAVIGGGFTGLSAAYHLLGQRPGLYWGSGLACASLDRADDT